MGFTREWFARVKGNLGLSLHPCIYDAEMQRGLIRETVDEFLAANADAGQDYWGGILVSIDPDRPDTLMASRHAGNDFADRLARIAPLLKDHSFADEKEWRLVAQGVSVLNLEYRPGESMLIPYRSIPIGDEDEFASISEIIVGPTPHPDLSLASVRSLAISAGLFTSNNSIVTRSTEIPFRSW